MNKRMNYLKMISLCHSYLFLVLLFITSSIEARENVYLHLDNDSYFLGETIWFSAYVTNDGLQISNSKVLYVELLSPEGNIVDSRQYRLSAGRASGEFPLPPLLLSGFFEIRAFTKYMMNWGSNNYFSRVIPVFNAVKNGDHSFYTMYDRKRVSKQVIPEEPVRTVFPQERRNIFSIDYDTACIVPYGLVKMKITGLPDTYFSISVTDKASHLERNKETSLADYITKENQAKDKPSSNIYQPEQGISVHGKLQRTIRRLFRSPRKEPASNIPMKADLIYQDFKYEGELLSDNTGRIDFCMGAVNGDGLLKLSYSRKEEGQDLSIILDRKKLPPRAYQEWETTVPELKLNVTEENDTILPKIEVKGKRRNYKWKPLYTSVLHLDMDEVLEYMRDEYDMQTDTPISLIQILSAYHVSSLPMRWVDIGGEYPGDTISNIQARAICDGIISASHLKPLSCYKQMIVRTDKPVCEYFSYGNKPIRSEHSSGGNAVDNGWFTSNSSDSAPSVVVFLVPKTDKELSSPYQAWNSQPDIRYTHVHGYHTPLEFEHKNYNERHPDGDSRRTLYWNPMLHTDKNGKAFIQFYNNSTCRQFHCSIDGITIDGQIITAE